MTSTLRQVDALFNDGPLAARTDAQLLARFVADGDQRAFAGLVGRHGSLVLAVCRGVLKNPDDADDAFQATFLILARKATHLRVGDSLGGWLRRVAQRVARQARKAERGRRRRETAVAKSDVGMGHEPDRADVIRVVREELDRLPESARAAVVLCELEGLTRDQAAEALGWKPGTVAGRLARARQRLRERLERRGVTASAFASLRPTPDAWANAVETATRAACVPEAAPRALALASRGLVAVRWKASGVAVTAGVLVWAASALPVAGPPRDGSSKKAFHAPPAPRAEVASEDPARAGNYAGVVVDTDARPIVGAKVYLVPQEWDSLEPRKVRAVTDRLGRFAFEAPDMTFTDVDGLPYRSQGWLMASADGFGPESLQNAGPESGGWSLTLVPDDVPIRGRLLRVGGKPAANVRVRLNSLSEPYRKDLNAYLENIKNPGFGFLSSTSRHLGMPPVLPVSTVEAVTDAEGRFEMTGFGRERLVLLDVKGPGVRDAFLQVMTRKGVEDGDPKPDDRRPYPSEFQATLPEGRTVRGVVKDRKSGAPIEGVWVGTNAEPSPAELKRLGSKLFTDREGRFTLEGLFDHERLGVYAVPGAGSPYFFSGVVVGKRDEVEITCRRGRPLRVRVVDETGAAVVAEVAYVAVAGNPFLKEAFPNDSSMGNYQLSRGERRPNGSYALSALPGPGAVLVATPKSAGYRPAHVDPKAFFAPGRTDWSSQDLYTAFGTHDTLTVATRSGMGTLNQHEYSAIVLIDSVDGDDPQEIKAVLARDRPRRVTLVDTDGKPVVGARSQGLADQPYESARPLRAATFPIRGLQPDRPRRVQFVHEGRKLIGFLLARADGDTPYEVTMRPWAVATGRILDPDGKPITAAHVGTTTTRQFADHDDPKAGVLPLGLVTDSESKFRAEPLIPGQEYAAKVYRGFKHQGRAFEGLVLAPGEVRDLGEIRIKPPVTQP